MKSAELLSPAKDAQTARAAILAGTDAVYIGGEAFGARSAAGNSVKDIAEVCRFAHIYGARVYLALNTILTDSELPLAERLAWEAFHAGVDALIVQDMGLLRGNLPPLPLHASTQCDIASVDKAKFLEAAGFDTLVLARELSVEEIAKIASSVSCDMEVFVHGALCVSYSGRCWMSCAMGGRSGNRGECAQPCRLKYSLVDSRGAEIAPPAHYLSLRDLNRSAALGELIDAGVRSFKIEGRLKDVGYVQNATLSYRRALDAELEKRGMQKSSFGEVRAGFEPNLQKTFNRGYTDYFGPRSGNASFSTPKSRGEYIGVVEKTLRGGFALAGAEKIFSNGDGLLFELPDGSAVGANVSGIRGDSVFMGRPEDAFAVPRGSKIWRNKDVKFERDIAAGCARVMPVNIEFRDAGGSFEVEISCADSRGASAKISFDKSDFEPALNAEAEAAKLSENLSKLGGTEFCAAKVEIKAPQLPHMKIARINAVRRELVEVLKADILAKHEAARAAFVQRRRQDPSAFASAVFTDFRANVLNADARRFYENAGVKVSEPAPESGAADMAGRPLMTSRHCVLRELGMCRKQKKLPEKFEEPLFLETGNFRMRMVFDCARCEMSLFSSPL